MKRICFSFFIALFALAFSSTLYAQVPTMVWKQNVWLTTQSISLHPSGQYLAVDVNYYDDTLKTVILETDSGKIVKEYGSSRVDGSKVLFSPNGNYIAFGGLSCPNLYILDYPADTQKLKISKHNTDFSFHPLESKIALCGRGYIDIQDIESGALLDSLRFSYVENDSTFTYHIMEVEYSKNGQYLVYNLFNTRTFASTLYLIDLDSRQVLFQDKVYNDKNAVFSPDGKYMAYVSKSSNGINVVDLATMIVIDSTVKEVAVTDIAFANTCKKIVYTQFNFGRIKILDYENHTNSYITGLNLLLSYNKIALSNDDEHIFDASGSEVANINIYNFLTSIVENAYLTSLTLSPNPTNQNINLSFTLLNAPQEVQINVYNEIGELVKVLFNDFYESENFSRNFDVSDLPNGAYILNIQGSGINTSANFIIEW